MAFAGADGDQLTEQNEATWQNTTKNADFTQRNQNANPGTSRLKHGKERWSLAVLELC